MDYFVFDKEGKLKYAYYAPDGEGIVIIKEGGSVYYRPYSPHYYQFKELLAKLMVMLR